MWDVFSLCDISLEHFVLQFISHLHRSQPKDEVRVAT